MATEGKKFIVYIRKSLVLPVRISYRFAQGHPFFLGMVFFLHILYRYCPTIFAFLVSSSPVILCTTLLLGILLVCGEPNTPETREDKRQSVSSRKGSVKGQNISSLRGAVKVSDDGGRGPMIKMDKPDLKSHLDSSVVSSCRPAEGHDNSSGSESDATDNSSPDYSVADFIPMLDELHPLLDSEAPQPAHVSADNSDAGSSENSQDNESDEDSADEEDEIQEDEEALEKDDTIEAVVTWTADDQKNLVDLGTSELERNQRLENLIAKRRARKFLSFHAEKNLIDLDSNDPVPNMDDILRFQHQIPSISAPRRNPFDLPFDTEEYAGLPPIPGSAPSVLQPRRNPFDLPLEQVEGSDNLARENMNHQEFAPTAQREMPYRRHESFTLGASFSMAGTQEPHDSKLKPYFVPERMYSEGTSLGTLQRQSSEKSDSKSSSTHESDTNSSIVDQKDQNELVEEFHMESHVLPNHYSESVQQGSQSSEEVDGAHEDVVDHHATHLNSSTEGRHQSADAMEMEIRHGEFHSTDAQAENIEVIEERYDGSSSSSSGANEKSHRTSIDGNEVNLEQTRNDTKDSSSVPADSDMSNITERADDTQSVDPVYDSSPSAVDKSLPNMSTFGESLLYAGKELSSGNSMTSDVQISSSEETGFVLDSRSTDEVFSGTTEFWIAPPSLAAVDEIESKSKEVSEVRELDVIPVLGPVIGPVPLEIVYPSHFSTAGNDSSNGRAVEESDLRISDVSLIPKSSSDDFRVGIATSSSLAGLQLITEGADSGDKLEVDVSSASGSTKLGKIRNMAKFW